MCNNISTRRCAPKVLLRKQRTGAFRCVSFFGDRIARGRTACAAKARKILYRDDGRKQVGYRCHPTYIYVCIYVHIYIPISIYTYIYIYIYILLPKR